MSLDIVLPIAPEAPARVSTAVRAWKIPPARPVLGLIDNTKARGRDLLLGVAQRLQERGIIESYVMVRKATPSVTVTTEQRARLLAQTHLIISGIGD